jgi:lipoprotein NlpD
VSGQIMIKFIQASFLIIVVMVLSACAESPRRVPVEEGSTSSRVASDIYVVRAGDTLFSIAWRYGLDFRKLANANSIGSSYVIYPGQKVLLEERAIVKRQSQLSRKQANRNVSSSAKKTRAIPSVPVAKVKPSTAGTNPGVWHWPTKGKVISAFGSGGSVHKGIDIAGKKGESVIATAAGRVVYAGSGILGYGNLLIVKHSEQYLSAYGHNSRLLVKEGSEVKARQKIAEKGNSGTNKVKLHFEIRREGKPIDPIRMLPRR